MSWRNPGSCFFFSLGWALRLGRLGRFGRTDLCQHGPELVDFRHHLEAVLQLGHLLLELADLQVWLRRRGASRVAVLQASEHPAEGPLFPLVVGFAGDAQPLGCLGGGHLARTDLQDHLRPVPRDLLGVFAHKSLVSKRLDLVALLLDLAEPSAQPALRAAAATLHDLAQARAEHRGVLQADLGVHGPEHSLHRPVLPVLEGDVVDLHLAADLRLAHLLGPRRQHRMDLLFRAEVAG